MVDLIIDRWRNQGGIDWSFVKQPEKRWSSLPAEGGATFQTGHEKKKLATPTAWRCYEPQSFIRYYIFKWLQTAPLLQGTAESNVLFLL